MRSCCVPFTTLLHRSQKGQACRGLTVLTPSAIISPAVPSFTLCPEESELTCRDITSGELRV